MSQKLPFRIRVPLAKLRNKKQAAAASAAVSQAIETGPVAGEQMWSARAPPNYLSLTLTSKVYDVAKETPLELAPRISERLGSGHQCYLKREDLQPGSSYKLRGVYNALYHQPDKSKPVVTYSRGGHGAAFALAAQQLGIEATIVMPISATQDSVRNVERLGCSVVLHGNTPEDARQYALQLADGEDTTYVPAFDHPHMIAGQGTVAMEIVNQAPSASKIDAIFCSVGGGDLLAGVSAYVKQVCPDVQVIGVEPLGANTMEQSLNQGHRIKIQELSRFADNAAVSQVGAEAFRVCDSMIDDIVVVSNDEICAAIKDGFEDTKAMLEPAGALAIAGMKRWVAEQGREGGNYVAVTSDANMKFDQLRFIADRALLGDATEAMVSVIIPERPGMFRKLYDQIYPRNVTEFVYRYSGPDQAYIFLAFELDSQGNAQEVDGLVEQLGSSGFDALNISGNEMAKAHARYLVGGRGPAVGQERLLSFEFPEQKGALKRFLQMLPSELNVSLFHYRNHGADVGRVLCGLQVPDGDDSDQLFDQFLDQLDYPWIDESENPVYKMFLKPSFRYKPGTSSISAP